MPMLMPPSLRLRSMVSTVRVTISFMMTLSQSRDAELYSKTALARVSASSGLLSCRFDVAFIPSLAQEATASSFSTQVVNCLASSRLPSTVSSESSIASSSWSMSRISTGMRSA